MMGQAQTLMEAKKASTELTLSGEGTDLLAGRSHADTIRLWDSYHQTATLWRFATLLQIPILLVSLIATLYMFFNAKTILEVPPNPVPGVHNVREISDPEFINFGVEFVNLIATYTPATAKDQFDHARAYLWDPALTEFEQSVMQRGLKDILETNRSQLLTPNEKLIQVTRFPGRDSVNVRVPGVRAKLIQGRAVPEEDVIFDLALTSVPRSVENKYGIVAVDVTMRILGSGGVVEENWKDSDGAASVASKQSVPAEGAAETPATKEVAK